MDFAFDPITSGIAWTCRVFSGPDSRNFLHRMTTLDTRNLQPGTSASWGFILTPVGKVRSAFHLSCTGAEEFLFEYDSGPGGIWNQALAEAIDQFTFAERQTLGEPQGGGAIQSCLWVFGGRAPTTEPGVTVIDHGTLDFGRRWWTLWGPKEQLDRIRSQAPALSLSELHAARMDQVRPWYSSEVTQEAMPLELGLLDGISEGKGCYPGQEVIERIITQGAPPRRLARLKGDDGHVFLGLVRKADSNVGTRVRLASGVEGVVEKCV